MSKITGNDHHHTPPPPPPPPPPVVTPPPAPTAVLDTTLASIGHEFQSAVSELLAGNTAASTDLAQTAFDLTTVTSSTTGQYGLAEIDVWFAAHGTGNNGPEGLTFGFAEVTKEITALAQPGIDATTENNLLWDIGQLTSGGPLSSMLFNPSGGVDATGLFTTPTATAPSPVALEDNATEYQFVGHLSLGETALHQNLGAAASGDGNHIPYTITQLQGFLDYVAKSEPDAAFAAKFAPDISHIATAGAEALKGLNDMLTNGGTASPHYAADQIELSLANSAIGTAAQDMISHNMPPPNFWLTA